MNIFSDQLTLQDFAAYVIFGCGLAIASFTDCTRYKVYNRLTIPLFLSGLALGFLRGGFEGLAVAMFGAFLAFALLFLPYLMGGLGAGDVKFMIAMGSWIGSSLLVLSILFGSVVIIIFHLIKSSSQGKLNDVMAGIKLLLVRISVFSRNLTFEDEYESVQSVANSEDSPQRTRLIPFSAVMSLGICLAIIVVKLWKSTQLQ